MTLRFRLGCVWQLLFLALYGAVAAFLVVGPTIKKIQAITAPEFSRDSWLKLRSVPESKRKFEILYMSRALREQQLLLDKTWMSVESLLGSPDRVEGDRVSMQYVYKLSLGVEMTVLFDSNGRVISCETGPKDK
jgi:hypothetical protein